MELLRATKELVLKLDRANAKIDSIANAVWGTIEGDITKQTDLQDELKKVKDSIPTKVPADGGNSNTVNGHTVESDVPANAKFTDTVYDDAPIKADIAKKADKVDTYTKPEVDNLIENVEVDLTNYYNKSEVDTKLTTKVDNDRVLTDVPANAKFTDTVYNDTTIKADIAKKADKTNFDNHTSDSDIHITSGERSVWNAKLDANKIVVVTELPTSPDSDTFYFIGE